MVSSGLTVPVLIVIAFLVLGILVLLSVTNGQRHRSELLRDKFGPEYTRTVERVGDRREAEAELAARTKRVQELDIHSVSPQEISRFQRAWQDAQARFVDDPSGAVSEADRLITQLIQARGYPMGDFEQRAADISVNYPNVVQNYRSAHEIALRNERGQASTEDLRQAMVYYRDLFKDLLANQQPKPVEEVSR